MKTQQQARLTIYLGGAERTKLLTWTKDFTHAKSDSEAIFTALAILKGEIEKQKKTARLKLAEKTRGIWAEDAKIQDALKDVRRGWKSWDKRLSSTQPF